MALSLMWCINTPIHCATSATQMKQREIELNDLGGPAESQFFVWGRNNYNTYN